MCVRLFTVLDELACGSSRARNVCKKLVVPMSAHSQTLRIGGGCDLDLHLWWSHLRPHGSFLSFMSWDHSSSFVMSGCNGTER